MSTGRPLVAARAPHAARRSLLVVHWSLIVLSTLSAGRCWLVIGRGTCPARAPLINCGRPQVAPRAKHVVRWSQLVVLLSLQALSTLSAGPCWSSTGRCTCSTRCSRVAAGRSSPLRALSTFSAGCCWSCFDHQPCFARSPQVAAGRLLAVVAELWGNAYPRSSPSALIQP